MIKNLKLHIYFFYIIGLTPGAVQEVGAANITRASF